MQNQPGARALKSASNKMKSTITIIPQVETIAALGKIPAGTVAHQSARLGVYEGEPLLVSMDAMLAYAKAYKAAYGSPVGDDGVLGPQFGQVIAGLRALLNGNGAVAMRRGITTDSKDNGSIETMYWDACRIAGMDGNSL